MIYCTQGEHANHYATDEINPLYGIQMYTVHKQLFYINNIN